LIDLLVEWCWVYPKILLTHRIPPFLLPRTAQQGNNLTLGRKLVRLGLTHEGSAEDFRTAALQVAPVPPALLDEQHHAIRQRYRQAYATADELDADGGNGQPAGTVGLSFVAAGNGDGGKVRHQRKDDELKPIFIKPQPKPGAGPPGERKSMLGLDKLAALKRAEKMMKEKLEEAEDGGVYVKKEEEGEEQGMGVKEEDEEGEGSGGLKKSFKVGQDTPI
jgi:hypothetical protein